MRYGLSVDDVMEIYTSIAPRAFAMLGSDNVLPLSLPFDYYTTPGEESDMLVYLLGRVNTQYADTFFEQVDVMMPPMDDAPAEGIKVNPYHLPSLYEDEVIAILLHEIAHGVGVWADQHTDTWVERVSVFHPALATPLLCQRRLDDCPYTIVPKPGRIPTLDGVVLPF